MSGDRLGTICSASPSESPADNEPTPQALLEVAKLAAEAGAKVVAEAVDKPRKISEKSSALDLVTETDGASEAAVLEVLRSRFPGHAVLGEEGGASGDASSGFLWCIDPLDGTTNFAHAYPAFAVSVGVMRGCEPMAGVVIVFAGGPGAWVTRTYAAAAGCGATMNGVPIHCSKVSAIDKSLLVTGFGYDHGPAWSLNVDFFKELTHLSQGVRRLGAASIDLCHVAQGMVDAYWEYQLKPWDVCAGVMVLMEAGGKITTMDGQPYSPFHRSMLASNGAIHPALSQLINGPTEALVKEHGIDLTPAFIPQGYDAGWAAADRG